MKYFYSFDEQSIPLWVSTLFWSLYMVVFVYAVWKMMLVAPKDKQKVKAGKLFLLYFAAYAVFYCINPDYFSYREWMPLPSFTDWNKELIYAKIIMFCRSLPFGYDYEWFRLIVWGGALCIVLLTSKMYRDLLNPGLAILVLFVLYCGRFCYARASLAMAVFFMGLGICLWARRLWGKLLGIGLAICSFFFHKELIIGIALLPCAILPFEKKKSWYLPLALLILMIAGITYINSNLELMNLFFGNDDMAQKIEHFNNKEQGIFRVSTLINYLSFLYPFFIITKCLYKQNNIPKPIAGIYRITFAILLASVSFFAVSGARSTYTYRVMYITTIPIAILITCCYNQGLFKNRQLAVMFLLALLSNSVRFINAI